MGAGLTTSRTLEEESLSTMKKSDPRKRDTPSRPIDARIDELDDWRSALLSRIRTLIKEADPEMIEERKWRKPSNAMAGVPVWSHHGIVCTGEMYKNIVKMTFAKGAELKDPAGLFNASLEGNVRRAIDFHQGDMVNERALKALIKAAVKRNAADRDSRTG